MLLHADGFDHYGTTADAATAGLMFADGYTILSNLYVFGPQVINGKGYSPSPGLGWLYFNRIDRCYFVRPVNVGTVHWCQFRLTFTAPPEYNSFGMSFLDAGGNHIAWVGFLNDLSLTIGVDNHNVFDGAGVVARLPLAYKPQTTQCWEIVYTANTNGVPPYNGGIAVYLEGQLQVAAVGLPLPVPAQHCMGSQPVTGGNANCFFRDYIVGDNTGAYNNVPFGPRRVGTRVASAVGGLNAWAVNGAANAALATNSIPPNGAKYIEGAAVNDITELTFDASPLSLQGVSGVIVKAYAQKTSVSACAVRLGLRSNATIVNNPDMNIGQGFSYWNTSFYEVDPNTGNPGFSKAAYDALAIRIIRSA